MPNARLPPPMAVTPSFSHGPRYAAETADEENGMAILHPLDEQDAEFVSSMKKDVGGQRPSKRRSRTSSSAKTTKASGARQKGSRGAGILVQNEQEGGRRHTSMSLDLSTSPKPSQGMGSTAQASLASTPLSHVHAVGLSPRDPASDRPWQKVDGVGGTETTVLGDSLANVSSIDGFSGCLERQNLERRQLIEWGENLYQEVGKFEQEKSFMEMQLKEVNVDRERLERELESSQRRCSELEALLRSSGAPFTSSPRDPERAENAELRKQLAAYAVEIDVLRGEGESGQQSLRDAQEAVRRLTEERESLVRSLQELHNSHHDVAGRCSQLQEILNVHGQEKTQVEGQLRNAMSELNVVGSSLQVAQARDDTNRKLAEQAVVDAERSVIDKENKISSLIDIIQPMQEQLASMQENFVKQTREFGAFIQRVRAQQQNAKTALQGVARSLAANWQDAKELPHLLEQLAYASDGMELGQNKLVHEWRRSHADLQMEIDRRTEQQRVTAQELRCANEKEIARNDKENARKSSRKKRLTDMFNPQISSQMLLACHEGVILQKVNEKGSKKAHRKVIVCEDSMRLKWVKHPFNFGKGESSVELRRLIYVAYGCMARAYVLFPTQCDPRNCFSVYTASRSYDFICRDEREAESFVVTISRLYSRICGWQVPGSIQTHASFVSKTAWSKVELACRQNRKTLSAALMDAAVRATNAWPLPHGTSSSLEQRVPSTSGLTSPSATVDSAGTPRSAAGSVSGSAGTLRTPLLASPKGAGVSAIFGASGNASRGNGRSAAHLRSMR
eukprot:TRINITY_DN9444_c0_g1_i1.p1 TRINITY_DN9444_c0_g1~~TRINITY_DN9444_c0_g1_i1.p1  ORF type:complete len:791 (-),score=126.29 TRINITY_DN9444_c0_g1_i1:192-2564(-)